MYANWPMPSTMIVSPGGMGWLGVPEGVVATLGRPPSIRAGDRHRVDGDHIVVQAADEVSRMGLASVTLSPVVG